MYQSNQSCITKLLQKCNVALYDPYSQFIVIPLQLTLEYTEKAIINNIVTNVGHYLQMTLYRNLTNCLG